ncbi:MAG: AMP-binding protein [Pseudomonadota bacterium]|nr:AMP-binding protein [Pseudomonadota bacterium]MEE2859676.1 AMP-binding protein [Pseudomonadota bacterium]
MTDTQASEYFPHNKVDVIPQADGGLILRSPVPLRAFDTAVCDRLWRWSTDRPDTAFLAERGTDGAWQKVTYAQAADQVRGFAAGFMALGLGQDVPFLTLCANSTAHALLGFGAMAIGAPYVPVTPAYAQSAQGVEKLRGIFAQIRPGLIVLDAWAPAAAEALAASGARIMVLSGDAPEGTLRLDDLTAPITPELEARIAAVRPEDVAKIMMTSGSTGTPKGVIHTHGLITSNWEMVIQMWPFMDTDPMVMVDWLPWSHCFGANTNMGTTYHLGGTFHIDKGRPLPGELETTIRNLTEVSPTVYLGVPSALTALAAAMETDTALSDSFFRRLNAIFFAGAGMPTETFDRIAALGREATGRDIPILSGWGATETGPNTTLVTRHLGAPGNIGIPAPGVEVKLTPSGDKMEMRVRSPSLTPGYWREPELTAASFDEDGFYMSGDAGRLENPDRPEDGLLFDGRLSEDFKLDTGSWVSVGPLRNQLLTAAPEIDDLVICEPNRSYLGLLIWAAPDIDRAALSAAIEGHNAANPGRSSAIRRVLIETAPPDPDAGEINAKGTINQRRVMQLRADRLKRLFAETPDSEVLLFPRGAK